MGPSPASLCFGRGVVLPESFDIGGVMPTPILSPLALPAPTTFSSLVCYKALPEPEVLQNPFPRPFLSTLPPLHLPNP